MQDIAYLARENQAILFIDRLRKSATCERMMHERGLAAAMGGNMMPRSRWTDHLARTGRPEHILEASVALDGGDRMRTQAEVLDASDERTVEDTFAGAGGIARRVDIEGLEKAFERLRVGAGAAEHRGVERIGERFDRGMENGI